MKDENSMTKSELRGCLKAAEANERLKDYKNKSLNQKRDDVRELVRFQSTALQAIRLELLMEPPNVPRPKCGPVKLEDRLEELLSEPAPVVYLDT